MTHSATLHQHEYIPPKAKVYYVIIVAALLAVAIAFFVIRGVIGSVDNTPALIQQHNNAANPGSTEQTGAPTDSTGTPTDRINPAPSGSGGNTLLNPEQ